MSEECRRHFIAPGIGLAGVFGNGARRHFVGKPGVAFRVAPGQPRRGAAGTPVNGGTNDDVRQRHPLSGADDFGNEAHVTTPLCGGSGKNMIGHSALPDPASPELPVRCCTVQAMAIRIESDSAIPARASRCKTIMQKSVHRLMRQRFVKYALYLTPTSLARSLFPPPPHP